MSIYFETGRSANSKQQKNQMIQRLLRRSYQKSNEFSVNRKCGQNVATDDRRTFTDKDKGRRIQTLGRCHVGLRKWLINVSLIIITLGRLHSLFLLKLSTLSAAIFLFVSLVLSLLCVYYICMLCGHVQPCLLFDRPEISNQSFVYESRRSLARHEYLQGGQQQFFIIVFFVCVIRR